MAARFRIRSHPFRWQGRAGEILERLKAAPELVDRVTIEKIFDIQKRSAWFLMDRAGARKVGTSLVVKREDLVAFVSVVAKAAPARDPGAVPIEKGRVESAATSDGIRRTPDGVEIQCADRKDLLARLAALAKSLQDPQAREKIFTELGL